MTLNAKMIAEEIVLWSDYDIPAPLLNVLLVKIEEAIIKYGDERSAEMRERAASVACGGEESNHAITDLIASKISALPLSQEKTDGI